jgi:signal transduction histidine kinase
MILIVDDRSENIFSLKTILAQHGFETDSALSGEEALKKVLKYEYTLIILDVQMPEMDGFEVAESLAGINKTRDIPIIFLSAVNTHKKFVTKGLESGAVEYLTKPVDPDILILKVRNFYRLYENTAALKEAKRALSETVDELHSTLEALPQLAFTTNREGAIEYVNKRWFQFSANASQFPEMENNESLQELWKKLIAKAEPVEKEVSIRKLPDGIFYHHLLRATPIKVNQKVKRWVGTFTSIHEQKLLHETLERKVAERTKELVNANRELENTNSELQQFTFVTSHDLKEPLRKVLFYGGLLREKFSAGDEKAKLLDKVINSSNRMSNLIEDLLSFASLAKPHLFELTDINRTMNDILVDLELMIAEKKAVFEIGKLPRLEVIPTLIRQLFQNIISNALKFSVPGMAPRIKVYAEEIKLPSDLSYCRIAISDNGIGFNEAYSEKIFTIFQRLNEKTAYEGTGIGLAIAKKIVDRHNGFISATSSPGEGSTFFIDLPLVQDPLNKHKEEQHYLATRLP